MLDISERKVLHRIFRPVNEGRTSSVWFSHELYTLHMLKLLLPARLLDHVPQLLLLTNILAPPIGGHRWVSTLAFCLPVHLRDEVETCLLYTSRCV